MGEEGWSSRHRRTDAPTTVCALASRRSCWLGVHSKTNKIVRFLSEPE